MSKTKKKEKPRCKNCGDETVFPSNTDGARLRLGWCVPCWRQAKRHQAHDDSPWVPPREEQYDKVDTNRTLNPSRRRTDPR